MRYLRRIVVLGLFCLALIGNSAAQAQSNALEWSKPIDMTQPSRERGGDFPKLLCDQHNNVHLFFGSLPAAGQSADIYYRTDASGAWSEPADIIAAKEPVAARFDAVISPQTDTVHLIWVNAWLNATLQYSQAPLANAADPRAWSEPVSLASQISNANNTGNATLALDSKGVLHVVYGTYDETYTQLAVQHITSSDNGQTWSLPTTVYSTVTALPSDIGARVALDGKDRLHVAITIRSQEYGVASEVGYIQSPDDGQSWSAYQKISDKSTSFQGLSTLAVYAFGADEIHLTWHDPRRLHQWSVDGGQTWNGPIEMIGLGAAFGGPNALTKDSAGNLYMVSATGDGVYSAKFDGAQWGTPERIDDRFIDPHGQDIVACQGNQLHVAYYDRTGDTRVWYSTRSVNAPHLDRQPIPVPTPQPTPTAVPLPPAQSTPAPNLVDLSGQVEQTQPDLFVPLITAIVPVILLLTGFIILHRRAR